MSTPSGKQWPIFTYSYRHKGKSWSFELPAEDSEDAQARLAAIHFSGKLEGRLGGTIPASIPAARLLVRTIVFLRNFLLSIFHKPQSDQ